MVAYVNKQKRIALDRNAKCLGLEMLNQIRSTIPAVTHVDYTARVQTVKKNLNPMYYAIINEFYQRTSCPIVINTSFNIRGEPIVCSRRCLQVFHGYRFGYSYYGKFYFV